MGDSNSYVRQAESRRLPTGTVVFLFTDVEGSTRRWESDPEKMSRALQLHDETLRAAIELRGGYVFKTVGDGVCAAFDRLTDAASAAETIVEQLSSDAFKDVGTLGVRIAVHMGEAYERDGDYFGPTVNRVARLLQIGHPGQIILSAAAAESLRLKLPATISLKYLEEHRLKDLAQPERVFQLVAPAIRKDFPPLRSLATMADNNLPLQSSALIGRETVVAEVRQLLETNRLVTLTGSGGIGKTRLALQAAAEMLDKSPDGVWFVDLASTNDPSLVTSVIRTALLIETARERSPLETLIRHLRSRTLLIVLDNCEHVIEEAASVAEAILASAPNVRVLATSREPLNISGERVFWTPSLAVPPLEMVGGTNEALRYGSVMLFVERARSADARFVMTDDVVPLVCEICRRLDGIALAVELAAARTTFLAPRELARQLDKRFGMLTAGRRTALKRQQTLRAAIDWSFDLLDGTEKTLFRRLAIFSDGWTLEAAAAVCVDRNLDAHGLYDTLASLVQKSLVDSNPGVEHHRFNFLESTHLYAQERLVDAGERDLMAAAHLKWVLRLAENASKTRGEMPMSRWLSALHPEVQNIREALDFARTYEGQPILAGRIVGALASFWFVAGLLQEGRQRMGSALTHLDERQHAPIVAQLSLGLAQLAPTKAGRDAALRAIALYEKTGDFHGLARGQGILAWVLSQIGELQQAIVAVQRALTIWRELGETNRYAYACDLDTYATILMSTGQEAAARSAFNEVSALFAALGEDEGAAISRFNLAELEFSAGHAQYALSLVTEAIQTLRRLKSWGRLVYALTNAAGYLLALDRVEEAREMASEVLSLGRRFEVEVIPSAIEHLAAVAASLGDIDRSLKLLGYVDHCYSAIDLERGATELSSLNIIIASAERFRLDGPTVEALRSQGKLLAEEDAVVEALRH